MRHGLDVRDEDVFWNMTDQGLGVRRFYGLVGPLLIGKSILFCDGPYDVSQGYRVLSKFRVTNLTAPRHRSGPGAAATLSRHRIASRCASSPWAASPCPGHHLLGYAELQACRW